jgi:hypothetical protein
LGSTSSTLAGAASCPNVNVTWRPLALPDREATASAIAVAQQAAVHTATATTTAKRVHITTEGSARAVS